VNESLAKTTEYSRILQIHFYKRKAEIRSIIFAAWQAVRII